MSASRSNPSRRELLKLAGATTLSGAAAAVPLATGDAARAVAAPEPTGSGSPAEALGQGVRVPRANAGPLQALTAAEADLLDAIVARLIPTDAHGPGAAEAGAVRYIDRALAGGLSHLRDTYRAGLDALDRYAAATRGMPFLQLAPTDQDSVLIDVETGGASYVGRFPGGSSAPFFALLLAHTRQGTFGDPFYGGNDGFVGWDLLRYPGVRTAVTADDQRLGARPTPLRKSAYDSDMFTRATASARPPAEGRDGDPA
jgi:gluconate 2-dehydrogenase gamma chain